MTGRSGDDFFGLQSSSDGLNTITDFDNVSGRHDMIAINPSDFGLTPGRYPQTVFESTDDVLPHADDLLIV